MADDRILGLRVTPMARRRLHSFRANRRGFWSLWIFLGLFVVSLFAELIANDKPLLVRYDDAFYLPVLVVYPETTFGGEFPTEADYRDEFVAELIESKGWMVWPPIRYGASTINYDLPTPAPSPPTADNWLGTDDQGRDVVARMIYGFRISVLFGLVLTVLSSIVGVAAGAVQGYFGGWLDLLFQRFIEIWSGLPMLYLLIILASVVEPTFWWLLGLLLLASLGLFWRLRHRLTRRKPRVRPEPELDPQRQEALAELACLHKPYGGQPASQWLQQLNALLKRLCRIRYPANHPHTLSGRAWLAFLDNRCPAAGLTRWMVLVEGAYRAECRLDDKAIDGLEQAVEIWIRKHV